MTLAKDETSAKERQEELEKELRKSTEEIKNLVDKLKYMDITIVDFVNSELKKLKDRNEQIQDELEKIKNKNRDNAELENREKEDAAIILDVIQNYFKVFDLLDLKSKRDILNLLIEDMKGNGKEVEITLLNTKISESNKKLTQLEIKDYS